VECKEQRRLYARGISAETYAGSVQQASRLNCASWCIWYQAELVATLSFQQVLIPEAKKSSFG
jgi:hypothetical protein